MQLCICTSACKSVSVSVGSGAHLELQFILVYITARGYNFIEDPKEGLLSIFSKLGQNICLI